MAPVKRFVLPLLASGLCFAFDQYLKQIVFLYRPSFFTSLVGLEYHKNYGFVGNTPAPFPVIIAVNIFLVCLLIVLYTKKWQERIPLYGLAFIIGGALSNLFDRLVHGFVIDYIVVLTSIFNIADVMIAVGAILIVVWEVKKID